MMSEKLQDTIADTAFCRNMPQDVIEKFGNIGKLESLSADNCLFQEGEIHEYVYLVIEGTIVLDIYVQGRGHVELLTLKNGEYLGWSPLFADNPMTMRAKTIQDCVIAVFPADRLREMCEDDHYFGYYIMKHIALAFVKRLTRTRLQLLDLFSEEQIQSSRSAIMDKPKDA